MTSQALNTLLLDNVVDLRFARRVPIASKPQTRRMLCTKSYNLLNSTNGRIVLNYKPPSRGKQFNENINNALVVWDIIMQDYRIVSCDSVQVIKAIPANEQFWKYFNDQVYVLNTEQKMLFMES